VVYVGAVIGLAVAVVLSRTISSFLFDVAPLDPLTFVSAAALLALTVFAAAATPAWPATRVDPMEAFRSE
jgi:ABC-type antimicrobial peptide transport system permease subunit